MTSIIKSKIFKQEKIAPYIFISPFYIIWSIFFLLPTVASFILAFYKWKGVKAPKFRGWGNYEYLFFKDKAFWEIFQNTIFYTVTSIQYIVYILQGIVYQKMYVVSIIQYIGYSLAYICLV